MALICCHCVAILSSLQVSAMLPGGLSVVGIFLAGSPEVVRSLHPRLRKLLGDLCSQHTTSSSFSVGLPSPPHMSRILLHICTKTKKYPLCTPLCLHCVCPWDFFRADLCRNPLKVAYTGLSKAHNTRSVVCFREASIRHFQRIWLFLN